MMMELTFLFSSFLRSRAFGHMPRMKNETLCKDLYVDGWKVNVDTDALTGQISQE